MILCIDSGNTRIKWAMHDGQRWVANGAVIHAEVARLSDLPTEFPTPRRVMLANVAGPAAAVAIRQHLAAWAGQFVEIHAAAQGGGVTNLYQEPRRLGVDRWCAQIGARRQVQSACLVVMAGTATTIDSLDAEGRFLGGLILPGTDLMCRALARDTAGLPFADGRHVDYPRCTDDAIVSGALEAQAGAIERAWHRLGAVDKVCLLSGGNASVLGYALVIPHVQAQNLPLEGLLHLAADY